MSNLPPYDYNSQQGGDSQPTYPASYNAEVPSQESYQPLNSYVQPYQSQPAGYNPEGYRVEGSYEPSASYQQPMYQAPYISPIYGTPAPEQGRGMAIAGLVMGILSIFSAFLPFVGLIFPILGVVFSILGRKSVSLRTTATVGLILSALGIVLSFVMIFVYYEIGSHSSS